MTDTGFMREALALAEKGMGFVSPNPLVGAVIVRNGEIIGRGWHRKYGEHGLSHPLSFSFSQNLHSQVPYKNL